MKTQVRSLKHILGSFLDLWKRFAHAIGVVNTHVFLFLAYVLVIGPVSIGLRVLRKDYLRKRRTSAPSYWLDREKEEQTLERAKYQF